MSPILTSSTPESPTLLTRDQLDIRLVEGHRLLLVHGEPGTPAHCRVLHRDEEVPMDLFTEYRDHGLLRSAGEANVFM